jgi:hypothetical protein
MTAPIQPAPREVRRPATSRTVEITVDGTKVAVPEGATILDACKALRVDTPTLCYAENLTPVNVCRVCVVELEGSRVLVPSCSRKAEPGMVVKTDSERVRTSRKVVLELLGSSVDLSTTPCLAQWHERYGADAGRFGPGTPAAEAGARDHTHPGHHTTPTARGRRPSHSRRRSTTSCSCATTGSACSATSASRRAGPTRRTRSRSRSPGAGSPRGSRPSSTRR